MATPLTSSIRIGATLIPSTHQNQVACTFEGLKAVSFTSQKRVFPSLQSAASSSSACAVFCVAKPETVKKVSGSVKKMLALSDDVSVTHESNFSEMGADSLDMVACTFQGLKAVSFTSQKRAFPSLQSAASSYSACDVFCVAKPETVKKVSGIVKTMLALSDDVSVTPESNFSEMGADSLDMLEILMVLEEEFEIIVHEEKGRKDNIITVRAVADKIEKYLEKVD